MPKFDSESPNNSREGSKFNRFPVLNSSSCAASFSSDEIYTATAHFCNEKSQNPQTPFCLNEDSVKELDWWVRNLDLSNGRTMITSGIRVVLQTDVSKKD